MAYSSKHVANCLAGVLAFGCAAASTAVFADDHNEASAFATLSLEELLSTEITTLSRQAENLGGAPAAVHVISQSDIRRSGARSIPELLRLVPGMQVAQLDANKWAVTSRGANGRFANKLLVLMDGRSVYDPALSGVYWDIQDTDLDAIERIEVIRGPGATMWGSNAVNGVVNIISKHAVDTQGETLSVIGGSGGNEATLRFGGSKGDSAFRVFAKATENDGNVNLAGDSVNDDSNMQRVGGRYDWDSDEGRALTISAEAYTGESGDYRINRYLTPPFERVEDGISDVTGGFVNAEWSMALGDSSDFDLKTYFLRDDRDGPSYIVELDTFDIDMQHRFRIADRHNVIWGLNYRVVKDEIVNTSQVEFSPTSRTQTLVSAFVQDDISFMDDRLRVIFGSKFEKNTFSPRDIEVSPSARLSFALNDTATLWGAVSRAVRMPSRGELDGSVFTSVLPPGQPDFPLPVPLVSTIDGNPTMRSETVIANEAGFRIRTNRSILDVAVFYNSFDELRSFSLGAPTCQPGGTPLPVNPLCVGVAEYVKIPLEIGNSSNVDTLGAELWWSQEITDSWRIQASYTYVQSKNRLPDGGNTASLAIEEDSPDHQLSIRSSANLADELEFDVFARWVDELKQQGIDAYTAVDIRLAWTPTPSWRFSLMGRNLFAGDHIEFLSELSDLAPVQIEPNGFVEIRWNF
ncbi:MAG: TonB-dependent receptor [Pseudomonadota bacterium]